MLEIYCIISIILKFHTLKHSFTRLILENFCASQTVNSKILHKSCGARERISRERIVRDRIGRDRERIGRDRERIGRDRERIGRDRERG